jgi:DNA-binding MarR family transcriptional regulator
MPSLTAHELELCHRVRMLCACDRLRRATRGVTQLYDGAVAASGMKVTQLPILVALGSAGALSVTTLAGAIELDRTTLTRNLAVLAQRGLVAIGTDPDDARVRVVSITAEGERVLAAALERWERVQRTVEERFGEERLRALVGELGELSKVAAEA